jgi:hypothetical protein
MQLLAIPVIFGELPTTQVLGIVVVGFELFLLFAVSAATSSA